LNSILKLYSKVFNLRKKIFCKETLRERAAITVALNSRPSGRSALYFVRANQPEGREIKEGTGGHGGQG
jgi:hypothetical protein